MTIVAWQEAVPARHALSPLVGAFTAVDGEQPRFLDIWAYASLEQRAAVRAQAVRRNLAAQGRPGGCQYFCV
ncbi:NIPSNAP family protein [Xylophilus sp.]|uniref:NIPSNAP family protein n=1 Tax=Xylophilus sp. TaxID=2653893 RepID=UPI0013BBC116|nr:NIPSNAP family protein [Xylophilus sp.]KAF1049978.1 MAG: hypothetical protein GAK38_00002 [Xylophilus sp.]